MKIMYQYPAVIFSQKKLNHMKQVKKLQCFFFNTEGEKKKKKKHNSFLLRIQNSASGGFYNF